MLRFNAAGPDTQPVYRWYNAESGDHLFTLDPTGELAPGSGYVAEGIAWYMYPNNLPGTVALYRWAAGERNRPTATV
ncbi:hypothetical protein [Caballeronia grimmiae]|uniref:DUF5648 domain-containing protein n=1 Tax=Caballeronia grimmiae TaxID=1071679 RepID=A0ABQ1SAJ0_9BURK|nr:hypothetical protein GCM10010985_61090 [Caballeronia grimmiae]